ncbi:RluA family pseudouridine synthase [Candidatus Magnetominusculus xianensis]|uniref:Pseudouridine synthase n=1 Tax=Candidatus Magnetominusculus xianensis TaxID=1748249 RepID=A0ABR5SED8_9BACT|nr:RluA family pseudouridine synthase [Candidatus Magnetominusculus xianensis]KWT82475.1 ribosomal large subunit pseudouridine synthase D [Candidatus Magnetominusculus xianensis]MBF0403195.1 RluA family pseudouridine synthase [Nitrospirota bacterium]
MAVEFHVTSDEKGQRLDVYLALKTALTRSQINKLIKDTHVSLNGQPVRHGCKIRAGDIAVVDFQPQEDTELTPQAIQIDVHYEDKHLIVVDKPPGMPMYPGAGHRDGTLMNAVKWKTSALASVGGPLRPGVVHRIDKDTSGLVVIALDDTSYYSLVEQFKCRSIKRRYLALIYGSMSAPQGQITLPIGRSKSDRKKMSTVSNRYKPAVTNWQTLKTFKGASLVEAVLSTGRTHQIRVHFSAAGHPVLGDTTYGLKTCVTRAKLPVPRQMLHAAVLGFVHPVTGQHLEFASQLPADMVHICSLLEAECYNTK